MTASSSIFLVRSHQRAAPRKKPTGRKRTALNRTLRAAVLKHIKTWSFPDLFKELQRNLDYRAFTQFFDEKIPSFPTFSRDFASVDATAIRELNWVQIGPSHATFSNDC
jgi:hypothetical protein